MKWFRYLIFVCLLSAVAAQATVVNKHAPADGYLDAGGYSAIWLRYSESEAEQPDALSATASLLVLPRYQHLTTWVQNPVYLSIYRYFQSRAPPILL